MNSVDLLANILTDELDEIYFSANCGKAHWDIYEGLEHIREAGALDELAHHIAFRMAGYVDPKAHVAQNPNYNDNR